MSMPEIKQENPIRRSTAITDLIESVALTEAALAHIMNAEGEKIQKIVKTGDTDDELKVNESVTDLLKVVTKLEILLGYKLDSISKVSCDA